MATQIYVKPILPKLMPQDANVVKIKIKRATERVCNLCAEELRFLFQPWQHKPDVKVKMEVTASEIKGSALTNDLITFFLDEGTKKRWALMSRDWQSKTAPGSLRSGHGAGRVVYRGQRQMQKHGLDAQRGITARKISETLMEKYKPIFNREIDKVMEDAIQKGQAVKP